MSFRPRLTGFGPHRPSARLVVAAASVVTLGGCGGSAKTCPRTAALEASHVLRYGDLEQVRLLLVDDRGQVPNSADTAAVLQRRDGAFDAELRARVEEPNAQLVTARYTLADGTSLVLSSRGDGFEIRFAPLSRRCPLNPVDALGALRGALAARTLPLSAVPFSPRAREEMETETLTILKGLEHAAELEIRETAHAARVTLPSGHFVSLIVRQGCWLIDEVV